MPWQLPNHKISNTSRSRHSCHYHQIRAGFQSGKYNGSRLQLQSAETTARQHAMTRRSLFCIVKIHRSLPAARSGVVPTVTVQTTGVIYTPSKNKSAVTASRVLYCGTPRTTAVNDGRRALSRLLTSISRMVLVARLLPAEFPKQHPLNVLPVVRQHLVRTGIIARTYR